jgi:hypothetical protein
LPADFLLPLFVVTLLANAFLVAFAIRGMRRGQPDADRPAWSGRPPTAAPLSGRQSPNPVEPAAPRTAVARTAVAPTGAARDAAVEPAEPAGPEQSIDPDPEARPAEPATEPAPDVEAATVAEEPDQAQAQETAPPPAPKRRRAAKSAADAPATRSRPAEPRRPRRRFSLPPLDDDHEKTNRSIESFLGGIDTPASGPSTPEAATTSAPPTRGVSGPTTVALIAVVGPPDARSAGAARGRPPAGTADTLAIVERTLRGAARGTDVVTLGRRGRFQIVLLATGELAARAYLRRIRAAIEPGLEAVNRSLHLAVATATVLDEPLDAAVRRAEDRLSLAIDAAHVSDRETGRVTSGEEADGGPDHQRLAPRAAAD